MHNVGILLWVTLHAFVIPWYAIMPWISLISSWPLHACVSCSQRSRHSRMEEQIGWLRACNLQVGQVDVKRRLVSFTYLACADERGSPALMTCLSLLAQTC